MKSNKHGTMEQNEEHLTMNILIYYTHKMELHARSYGKKNRAPEYANLQDLAVFPKTKQDERGTLNYAHGRE